MAYILPYGKGELFFQLNGEVQEIKPSEQGVLPDVAGALREAINNPIGSESLARIVQPGDKTVIVVSDITRLWVRTKLIVPVLLDELNKLGVPDRDISIVVALGDHRPLTRAEHLMICGDTVLGRIAIHDHDCRGVDLVDLGFSSRGTPVLVNRRVWEADRVILTGGISYHLMAGFGGGRKSLAPGVCGYETIQRNHGLALAPGEIGVNPRAGTGLLTGNPVAEDMMEIAEKIGADFIVNVVVNNHQEPVYIAAGALREAHLAGCRVVEEIYGVRMEREADLVLASCGGYPKDMQLYQAIKALDNASYAVRAGGVIVLAAECADGVGSEPFLNFFVQGDVEELQAALYRNFTMPGFVALRTAEIARRTPVILVSVLSEDVSRQVKMRPAASADAAVRMALELLGGEPQLTYLMSHASGTFPQVSLCYKDDFRSGLSLLFDKVAF